jgi:hypothetical protein
VVIVDIFSPSKSSVGLLTLAIKIYSPTLVELDKFGFGFPMPLTLLFIS